MPFLPIKRQALKLDPYFFANDCKLDNKNPSTFFFFFFGVFSNYFSIPRKKKSGNRKNKIQKIEKIKKQNENENEKTNEKKTNEKQKKK